jgi:hypothetical protein
LVGKRERQVAEARERRQAFEAKAPPPVPPRSLAKLVVLGTLSALWSVVLWEELVRVRSGGGSFCGLGGKFDCSAVWNGAFASTVHKLTALPIAGWGLVWSVVAFFLPLAALLRRAENKPIDPLVSAVRLTGLAGIRDVRPRRSLRVHLGPAAASRRVPGRAPRRHARGWRHCRRVSPSALPRVADTEDDR